MVLKAKAVKPKGKPKSKAKPKKMKIVESPQYRTIFADGALVSAAHDENDMNFYLSITRMDAVPHSETIEGKKKFDSEMKRVKEVTAVLTPARLFSIAQLIMSQLSKLSEQERKKYGVPEISMKTVKRESEND